MQNAAQEKQKSEERRDEKLQWRRKDYKTSPLGGKAPSIASCKLHITQCRLQLPCIFLALIVRRFAVMLTKTTERAEQINYEHSAVTLSKDQHFACYCRSERKTTSSLAPFSALLVVLNFYLAPGWLVSNVEKLFPLTALIELQSILESVSSGFVGSSRSQLIGELTAKVHWSPLTEL